MDVKKVILIVVAMIVALGAAFGVNTLMRGSATQEAKAAAAPVAVGPKVMVATRPLPVGTILTQDALRFQPWPEGLVKPDQYYLESGSNIEALVGSVVRVAITPGSPVTKGALVNPGDRGFLAAALGPGMRAVTVPARGEQGVAGFIFPGDRVDMLLTLGVEGEGETRAKLYTSETIIRNLRVLAVDQRTVPTGQDEGQSSVVTYGTVTVEVTPRIAEAISVARSTGGQISFALRSIADNASELEQAIATGSVSVPKDGDATAEQRMLRGMASQPVLDNGGAVTTGGDVSRFLRRGLPPANATPRSEPRYAGPQYAGPTAPAMSAPPAPAAAPVRTGPTVRVVRGNQVTEVPVGR